MRRSSRCQVDIIVGFVNCTESVHLMMTRRIEYMIGIWNWLNHILYYLRYSSVPLYCHGIESRKSDKLLLKFLRQRYMCFLKYFSGVCRLRWLWSNVLFASIVYVALAIDAVMHWEVKQNNALFAIGLQNLGIVKATYSPDKASIVQIFQHKIEITIHGEDMDATNVIPCHRSSLRMYFLRYFCSHTFKW